MASVPVTDDRRMVVIILVGPDCERVGLVLQIPDVATGLDVAESWVKEESFEPSEYKQREELDHDGVIRRYIYSCGESRCGEVIIAYMDKYIGME